MSLTRRRIAEARRNARRGELRRRPRHRRLACQAGQEQPSGVRRRATPLAALARRSAAKIHANPLFRLAARPKSLTPLILSRYEPGMEYGSHVDDALMNGMRTDVSFTLFLSDPDTYDGGALVIESAGRRGRRPAAGRLAGRLRVDHAPSRRAGHARRAARGRRLGAKLRPRPGEARAAFRPRHRAPALFKREGKTAEFDLLSKSSANLLRMWAED